MPGQPKTLQSFLVTAFLLGTNWPICSAIEPISLPREHRSNVSALAFSPDGSLLVSGADDKKIHVWDVASQRSIARLDQGGFVRSVAFSPDGTTVAAGDTRGTIKLWNTASRRLIHVLKSKRATISSIVFSPTGETLISSGRDVGIWDVKSGEERQRIPTSIAINDLTISPDGDRIALATGGRSVLLWDLANEKVVGRFSFGKPPTCVTFSPNGKQIVAGALDFSIRRWQIDNEQEIGEPIMVDSMPCKLAYTPDGKTLVTITTQGTVLLLESTTGGTRVSWKITSPQLTNCFAISHDGATLATNHGRSTIGLWKLSQQ